MQDPYGAGTWPRLPRTYDNRLDTVNNEMSQQSTIYLHNVLRVNRTKANIMKIRVIILTHLTVCICELCLKLL